MKRKLEKAISIVIFIIIILGGYLIYVNFLSYPSIKIANWNLEVFGEDKSENIELMNVYVDKIEKYDIIFVQEIRDKSESSFTKLCSELQGYSCKISSRAGRTSFKEQYGVIYKKEIDLIYLKDYNPDSKDRWERPPIEVSFKVGDYSLTIYNIHVKPDDVQNELSNLENVVSDYGNVIILGDLNADCSYYNNKNEKEFENWNWIVKDSDDTAVSSNNCAYDRIILNDDAKKEYKGYGIDKKEITKEVSNHYLVWVRIKIVE
ncbi:MAG: hypothetical protein Q8P15_02510 [Nanoarchaeota archaeon]|nr:hypothetical protein [Nanoarchaeota archaeon]